MSRQRSPPAPSRVEYYSSTYCRFRRTPILISATMDLGQVVLLAASLSFIVLAPTTRRPPNGGR